MQLVFDFFAGRIEGQYGSGVASTRSAKELHTPTGGGGGDLGDMHSGIVLGGF